MLPPVGGVFICLGSGLLLASVDLLLSPDDLLSDDLLLSSYIALSVVSIDDSRGVLGVSG